MVLKYKENNMKKFNYEDFKSLISSGDLSGLEYLESTIIQNCKLYVKENNQKLASDFIIEEYILSLFYATKELNNCNFIYECTSVKNNFNYDIYYETRDLFLRELFNYLGIKKEIEDLWN
jgi:hypothetical protein